MRKKKQKKKTEGLFVHDMIKVKIPIRCFVASEAGKFC